MKTLTDALVVFEVLSDDTAAADHSVKLVEYAELPSIACYVLLEQDRRSATIHRRRDGQWQTASLAACMVAIPEIDVELPLDSIYAGLSV